MKVKLLVAVLLAFAFCQAVIHAQNYYQFVFRGTSYQTNSAGGIQGRAVSDKTLLQEWTQAAGVNPNSVALAYHVGGNELGDTVDVVDVKSGATLDTLFGFYFGESFARVAIKNSNDTQEKRLDYIYTTQDSHSLGAALVNKRIAPRRNGSSQVFVRGQMNYVISPNGGTPAALVSGTFSTGKPLRFGQ